MVITGTPLPVSHQKRDTGRRDDKSFSYMQSIHAEKQLIKTFKPLQISLQINCWLRDRV